MTPPTARPPTARRGSAGGGRSSWPRRRTRPTMYSPCWPPAVIGGHARDPRSAGAPDIACRVSSVADPVRPRTGEPERRDGGDDGVRGGRPHRSSRRPPPAPSRESTARRPSSPPTPRSSATSAGILGVDGDALLPAGQPLEQRARLPPRGSARRSRSSAAASALRAARPAPRRSPPADSKPPGIGAAQRGGQVEHPEPPVGGSHRRSPLRIDRRPMPSLDHPDRGVEPAITATAACNSAVPAGVCESRSLADAVGRQSGRDRHPHHAGRVRARDPVGRRPLRRRRRVAAHPQGRRVAAARQGAGAAAYLDIDRILADRRRDRLRRHPPRLRLPERERRVSPARCAEEGIRFVGPSPEVLALFGDKAAARSLAERLGVPVLRGTPAA